VSRRESRAAKPVALALAGMGLAHFARPQLFEPITEPAFPSGTRRHVYTNGGVETAIGLAMASRRTRKLAMAALLGYGAYLAGNTVRNR
jgi:uncharacterized membrane protein